MPMWRCPHCGIPQAETARCWVCHRSSTACLTCRHFRRSVAPNVGYCGLDRRRAPLAGDEIRACWEAGPLPSAPTIAPAAPLEPPVARLDFIEIAARPRRAGASLPRSIPAAVETATAPTAGGSDVTGGAAARWSLWDDLAV